MPIAPFAPRFLVLAVLPCLLGFHSLRPCLGGCSALLPGLGCFGGSVSFRSSVSGSPLGLGVRLLRLRNSPGFPLWVLALALGFYLPPGLALPLITLGSSPRSLWRLPFSRVWRFPFRLSACVKWFGCLAFCFPGNAVLLCFPCSVHMVGSWGLALSGWIGSSSLRSPFRLDIACLPIWMVALN